MDASRNAIQPGSVKLIPPSHPNLSPRFIRDIFPSEENNFHNCGLRSVREGSFAKKRKKNHPSRNSINPRDFSGDSQKSTRLRGNAW